MPTTPVVRNLAWARDVLLVYAAPALIINLGNVAAYLFQVLLGRALSVEAFGSFNGLFSSILILTAPASFLPLLVAQASLRLAGDPAGERALMRLFVAYAVAGGAALCVVAAILAFGVGGRFDVTLSTGLACLATIVGSCLHPVVVGLIQARRHYVRAAWVVGGNPLLRVVFGLLLVSALGFGANGAMWSVALPVLATVLLGFLFLSDLVIGRGPAVRLPDEVRLILRHAGWRQAAVVTLIVVLSNLDIVIAQFVLSGTSAGYYAAAAVVSRIALLLPSALATIIFTESARSFGDGRASAFPWEGIALTAALAGAIAVAFLFAGDWIVVALLGADYAPAGDIFRFTGAAMAALSVSQAVAMTLAGRGNYSVLPLMLIAVGLIAIVPSAAGLSATGLALLMLVTNLGLLAACLAIAFRLSRLRAPR